MLENRPICPDPDIYFRVDQTRQTSNILPNAQYKHIIHHIRVEIFLRYVRNAVLVHIIGEGMSSYLQLAL